MKFLAIILTVVPAVLAAIGDTCTHAYGKGTCQLTTSCTSGYTVSGACPNDGANIKCCTKKSCAPPSGSGVCKNTSAGCSGGSFISGYCPGPADIKCCVPNSSGGGTGMGAKVLAAAMTQDGVPYSWGGGGCSGKSKGIEQGKDITGFDCSGLTQYAVCQATKAAGKQITLPRTTRTQYAVGKRIPLAQRAVGDLLYYATGGDCSCKDGYCPKLYHVAIWAGNGKMYEAQKTGVPVGMHAYRTANICPYAIRHW